jgi:TM2 domain-containing membrane protein YozV
MTNASRVMISLIALAGLTFAAVGEPVTGTPAGDSAAVKDTAAQPPHPQGLVLTPKVTTYDFDAIPKDPLASALLSASLPGTGQIYNKEYLRGIITGVVFYGSFFSIQYLLSKWDELNLDTFYIREAYDSTKVHMAVAPKPEDEQVGLATGDKVWLIATLTLVAASYVFGVVDAYYGAKRYNKKLFEGQQRLKLGLSVDPVDKKLGVCAKYQF